MAETWSRSVLPVPIPVPLTAHSRSRRCAYPDLQIYSCHRFVVDTVQHHGPTNNNARQSAATITLQADQCSFLDHQLSSDLSAFDLATSMILGNSVQINHN